MANLNFCLISFRCMFAWTSIAIIGFQLARASDQDNELMESFITQSTPKWDDMEEADKTTTTEEFSSAPTPSPNQFTDMSCNCGVRSASGSVPSGKIIGGSPVLNDADIWPWFGTLIRIDRPTSAHCGSSLISPRYLLTAAHCLLPMIQVGLRNFKVNLGSNDLGNPGIGFVQASIESVTVHPKFEQSYPYHYDIGLVKLSSPITCSRKIRPICLPETPLLTGNEANVKAITAGFGKTSMGGNYSRVLHQIELDLVPNEDCRHNFSKLSFPGPPILDNMLCAWALWKDPCVADSGGPLIVPTMKHKGNVKVAPNIHVATFVQVGITSWGIGCAHERYPGVYTRVDKHLSWINSILK